jgi:branched-chain amino acid transport system permease protein
MQIILNGLMAGAAIALLAIAFQIVYLPTRVFFLGLAGIYSAAPFVAVALYTFSGNWVIAVLGAAIVCIALSVLMEWANHAVLSRRNASDAAQLISSLGIYIVLVQAIVIVWGNDTRTLTSGVQNVTTFGDVFVTSAQLTVALTAFVLLAIFSIFLMRSNLGLRLRALADNPAQFMLFGKSSSAHRLLAFGFGGFFAAASSLVTANDIGFDPYVGLHAVLLAVVAVIIGGQSSFFGPVLGALLLGLIRAQVVWYASARWQEAATFLLLAIFLLFKPQGLLTSKTRLEALQ